jgi:hypothetical protein
MVAGCSQARTKTAPPQSRPHQHVRLRLHLVQLLQHPLSCLCRPTSEQPPQLEIMEQLEMLQHLEMLEQLEMLERLEMGE